MISYFLVASIGFFIGFYIGVFASFWISGWMVRYFFKDIVEDFFPYEDRNQGRPCPEDPNLR